MSGLLPRATWLITLGCFALFTLVSLNKALSGAASCGCFGTVQVNPWYTTVLDAAAVIALLRYHPVGGVRAEVFDIGGRPVSHYISVTGTWLVVAAAAGWGMTRFEAATVGTDGDFIGDSEIVVLEPEKWIGKPFALRRHIDMGERLAVGRWTVLLYHHDCPQCQAVRPKYERLAWEQATEFVALIEVPPYGADGAHLTLGGAVRGRLRDTREWFVKTPAEIRLEDGLVTAVCGAAEMETGHGS